MAQRSDLGSLGAILWTRASSPHSGGITPRHHGETAGAVRRRGALLRSGAAVTSSGILTGSHTLMKQSFTPVFLLFIPSAP